MLVDFGYAILDSLENEVSEMDNSVMGSGGRAALSAIPSALKRWNEESCVIDGDSMHNCVTALKPTILEVCNFKVLSSKHRAEQPLQETVYFGCRNSKRSGISSCKNSMLFTKIAAF